MRLPICRWDSKLLYRIDPSPLCARIANPWGAFRRKPPKLRPALSLSCPPPALLIFVSLRRSRQARGNVAAVIPEADCQLQKLEPWARLGFFVLEGDIKVLV